MKRIVEEVLREAVRDAEEFYGWTKEKRAGGGFAGGRWEVGEGGGGLTGVKRRDGGGRGILMLQAYQ